MQLFQKNVKFFSFVLMFFSFVNAQSSISGNVSDSETGEVRSMFSFPDFTLDSFIGPMSVQEWNKLTPEKNKGCCNLM